METLHKLVIGQSFLFGNVVFKKIGCSSNNDAATDADDVLILCHVGETDNVVYIANHALVKQL